MAIDEDLDTCQCGHVRDEHGQDPDHPGSSACNVPKCPCLAFDYAESEDDEDR